jgi:glycosyltransferase involved in cell wall biosynthesis
VRVCVLTTSYPREVGDVAGAFVAELVERTRAAGVEVSVVSPASFRHFGIAYGSGIPQNLRAAPWRLLLLPLFLAAFARAARRGARDADLVHAHWLFSALPALATNKPLVVQLWGSDVALAGRLPRLARLLLRRAHTVLGASEYLAAQARSLGARTVAVVPLGLELPAAPEPPAEPPHVLYVGRLSEEKGILEFLAASAGLPRVVVGDGPLRERVPDALGFVPPAELGPFYTRAALVCVPSRREGYGVVAREAMAYARPVVASAVGGLADAVSDGETGLLVPPRDPVALRAALERLLGDRSLRVELGAEARRRAERDFSWERSLSALLSVYAAAARPLPPALPHGPAD